MTHVTATPAIVPGLLRQSDGLPPRLPPASILCLIAAWSLLVVYTNTVAIGPIDATSRATCIRTALNDYREALSGTRGFPAQWRLLGIYLVYGAERVFGAEPYMTAAVIKTAFLAIAATCLFQFSSLYTTMSGSVAVLVAYFVMVMAAFQDGYSIYYCNDYIMLACWFGAVYLVRLQRLVAASLVTFVGAWAKETLLLVPLLLGVMYLRKRVGLFPAVAAGVAFAIPTFVLRWWYPAPLTEWAWWRMLLVNTPLLQADRADLLQTLQYNAKVLVFLNVFLWCGIRGIRRSGEPLLADLGLTCAMYVPLAYDVVFIRELRHFLPLAIALLPAAVSQLEASHRLSAVDMSVASTT